MSLSSLREWLSHRKPLADPAADNQTRPAEAEAQFQLGLKLASGNGQQDYARAAQWYGKAAAQNHVLAQFNLSAMYAQGQGVDRDEAKSLMWLTRAAVLGDAGAQYRLGIRQHLACRNTATGTAPETRIEALKWVRLSAAQGYRQAEQACEFVTFEMTREEVAEGARRVSAFVAEEKSDAQPDARPEY
jgi:TPR repeat protein